MMKSVKTFLKIFVFYFTNLLRSFVQRRAYADYVHDNGCFVIVDVVRIMLIVGSKRDVATALWRLLSTPLFRMTPA